MRAAPGLSGSPRRPGRLPLPLPSASRFESSASSWLPRCVGPEAPESRARRHGGRGERLHPPLILRRSSGATAATESRNARPPRERDRTTSRCALRLVFSTASRRILRSSARYSRKAAVEFLQQPRFVRVAKGVRSLASSAAACLFRRPVVACSASRANATTPRRCRPSPRDWRRRRPW